MSGTAGAGMRAAERPRLAVGILTFRRPEQLRASLAAVRARTRDALGHVDARIVVVDNDPDASARSVVVAMRDDPDATHPIPIDYAHEPRPGIAAARNRALDEAGDAHLLAFIDDDEIPQPGWLTSLVEVWRSTGADAVMGRVVAQLPPGTEPWVASSAFFQRATHTTGTLLEVAATGNLLLDLTTIRRMGLRFDESLGLAGGEDTVFTSMLTQRGGTIVWCQESVTIDPVVPERATREWVLQRAFAHGNRLQQTRLRLAATPGERAVLRLRGIAGGLARIGLAAGQLVWGASMGDARRRHRSEIQLRRGWGVLVGGLGHQHEEYRRAEAAR